MSDAKKLCEYWSNDSGKIYQDYAGDSEDIIRGVKLDIAEMAALIESQAKEIEKRRMIHEDYRRTALERIAYQESEIETLTKFAKEVINAGFEGDLDGGQIQEMGVKYGFLVEVAYDPEKHGDEFLAIMDPGDTLYLHTLGLTEGS